MAKKDFTSARPDFTKASNVVDELNNTPTETQETQSNTQTDTAPIILNEYTDSRFLDPEKVQYYRFNLKMPLAYHNYLKEAAYTCSTPRHTVTITEYINMLIKEDMKAHSRK